MISVSVRPGMDRQLFTSATGRLLAELSGTSLREPPCSVFGPTAGDSKLWAAPELTLDGEWPRDALYNVPLSPGFMDQAGQLAGRIAIRGGFRNAGLFLKHRKLLRNWVAEWLKTPHQHAARKVFLLKSSMRAAV